MKILYKDDVKVICKDDHKNADGWNVLEIPNDYNIYKTDNLDGLDSIKDIEEIKRELESK